MADSDQTQSEYAAAKEHGIIFRSAILFVSSISTHKRFEIVSTYVFLFVFLSSRKSRKEEEEKQEEEREKERKEKSPAAKGRFFR